ncbi:MULTISPECIES: hypothetical protein [Acidobacterium]|uniref:Lipoprotein n=1 Tax=Acidobacterium capsulatum (strain ATCC 51196 / DSM 11244 / BCRC 80197 / JCM 7670 / NBRC 15755 / NCIMB 13165 / 161) TaxID=240015 RepID=C1F5H8_ACIC5|nr:MULTISPECIES: hypothetical protein [Acidobacterium]ACO33606.1 hypothetical protein ACP_1353 [Acidobacterium capsulatum ATCC 51196]
MKLFSRGCMAVLVGVALTATAAMAQSGSKATVLDRTQAGKIMPATVFFRGQTAPTQERNSGGVHFADGKYMLAALVDTSGYATEVRQSYQGYLLTEVKLDFGGHTLVPGAYGFGFLAHHQFVVLNLAGQRLLEASSQAFAGRRPVPLEVLAGAHGYELCSGRECVDFHKNR